MKKVSIIKHNLLRATLTLALMVTCATAWAGTVQTYYIDENGTRHDVTATVLTGTGYLTANQWYVVNSDVTIENSSEQIRCTGNINLILADGKTFTISSSHTNGIICSSDYGTLNIYGQENGTGTLNVTATGSSGNAIYGDSGVNIVGCKVTAISTGANGIFTHGNITISGGQVSATGNSNYYGINTGYLTLGWRKTTDHVYASSYYEYGTVKVKDGLAFKDNSGNIYVGTLNSSQISAIAGKTLTPDISSDFAHEGNTYTIITATGWGYFCDSLDNKPKNYFSGKTVYLANDIEVSRMAGAGPDGVTPSDNHLSSNDFHGFSGTFDGNEHTLTFNLGNSDTPNEIDYVAPFRYTNDATIQRLHVAGTIYTSNKHAAGLIGCTYGTTNITDCRSSINIISSIPGDDHDGTHGGIMACSWKNSTTNIEGCLFDGSIQSAENFTTDQCGGFVGWKNGTINVTNSLLTADLSTIGAATGETYPSATFVRNGNANTITNCYYTEALGTPQGTKVYSITAGQYVTVDYSQTPTNTYATSGIATYGTAIIKCNDVLYACENDNVNLTLDNNPPTGFDFINYTVSPEGTPFTGSGNTYTLTMPNADVEIGATFELLPGTIPYLDMNGQQRYCINSKSLTNSMTTLGRANHETWYVADGTINFTKKITVQGNVHLILKDGAVMNVGTKSTPISDTAISANRHSISIYAQSTGANKGQLHVYGSKFGIYAVKGGAVNIGGGKVTAKGTGKYGICSDSGSYNNPPSCSVTISGGEVTATGGTNGIIAFRQNSSVTISGGQVTAIGGTYGIQANKGPVTISGGQVTATGNSYGIYALIDDGSVTISGGQVTATGGTTGIYARNSITLGWTNYTDFIHASNYGTEGSGSISIASGKAFVTEDDATYSSGTLNSTQFSALAGKTLYPQGVIFKEVAGYGEGTGGWVFIASPVAGSISPTNVHNLLGSYDETTGKYDYDLYRFNQSPVMNNENNYLEWENYHQHNTTDNPFMLVNGQGYLYATQTTKKLVFAGEYNTNATQDVALTYSNNNPDSNMHGWNLVGNPFPVAATVTGRSYYVMDETGTGINPEAVSAGGTIDACTGIVVKAEENETEPQVTFTRTTQQSPANQGTLQIAVAQNNNRSNTIQDNAIVSFNEGDQLGKFYFGTQNANIYIPQNGKEYAIACSSGQGEMPINFKATENGTYTISVNPENVEMAYLHLIDNMTGADVDLLTPPAYGHPLTEGDLPLCKGGRGDSNTQASYTFTARTTDYESRFKLVFIANDASTGSASDATFAFISNGNIIVNGEGTLQVVDVMGRVLVSVGGHTRCVPTAGMAPGVYVLRLIDGDNVRTQKIVVR